MLVVKGPNATGETFGFRVNKDSQFEAGSEPVSVSEKDVPLIQCYLDSGHLEEVEKPEPKKAAKGDAQKPDSK